MRLVCFVSFSCILIAPSAVTTENLSAMIYRVHTDIHLCGTEVYDKVNSPVYMQDFISFIENCMPHNIPFEKLKITF